MTFYHCSPVAGLKILQPQKPQHFEKAAAVYLTTLRPMALMYGIRNYEYTYGYTKAGVLYFDEYFSNALEILYRGKCASLYLCAPEQTVPTQIPNEAVSERPVPITEEILIADVCQALLDEEKRGTLRIHRYEEQSPESLDWIFRTEVDTIRGLLQTTGPQADYYRMYYPKCWAFAQQEV